MTATSTERTELQSSTVSTTSTSSNDVLEADIRSNESEWTKKFQMLEWEVKKGAGEIAELQRKLQQANQEGATLSNRLDESRISWHDKWEQHEDIVYKIVQLLEERLTSAENDVHGLSFQQLRLEDCFPAAKVELLSWFRARENELKEAVDQLYAQLERLEGEVRQMTAGNEKQQLRVARTLDTQEECLRELVAELEDTVRLANSRLSSKLDRFSSRLDSMTTDDRQRDSRTEDVLLLEKRLASGLEERLGRTVARLVTQEVEDAKVAVAGLVNTRLDRHARRVALVRHDADDALFHLQEELRREMGSVQKKMATELSEMASAVMSGQKSAIEEASRLSESKRAASTKKLHTEMDALGATIRQLFKRQEAEMETLRGDKDELLDEYYRVADELNAIKNGNQLTRERFSALEISLENGILRAKRAVDGVDALGDRVKNYHAKLMILDDAVVNRSEGVERRMKAVEDANRKLASERTQLEQARRSQMEGVRCEVAVLENRVDALKTSLSEFEKGHTEEVRLELGGVQARVMAVDDRVATFELAIGEHQQALDKCRASRKSLRSLKRATEETDKRMDARLQIVEAKLTQPNPKEKSKKGTRNKF